MTITETPDTTDTQHHDPASTPETAPSDPTPPVATVDREDAAPLGELVAADPRELVLGANVRRDVALDKPFLRSIADRGVREPIIARRGADDALVVRKGKRRTLAAIEVGRPWVPVLVEPAPDPGDEDRDAQVERIVDQLEENQHRAGTTDADEVRAHQELLDLGLTAGQIARRTHVPTSRVKVTAAVARSALATAVLERYDLTLDQVAVIAEFDDGTDAGTEAVKALTVTAAKEPAQFGHVTQRLRDDRDDARLVSDRAAELTAAGVRVIGEEATVGAQQISGLRADAETPSGTELTAEVHASCPGQAVTVEVHRGWGRAPQVRVVHWCTDPDANGHLARWNNAAAAPGTGSTRSGAMTEQEKAQRRQVIAHNKDWDSATTVRRDWLRTFLARRTPPRDAMRFIATTLARAGHDLRRAMESGHPTACDLLGMAPTVRYGGRAHPIAEAAQSASTPRATVLTLAVLLGAAEDATDRQTWRHPSAEHRAYFIALQDWGYQLSPVEQLVLTDPTPIVAGDLSTGEAPNRSMGGDDVHDTDAGDGPRPDDAAEQAPPD